MKRSLLFCACLRALPSSRRRRRIAFTYSSFCRISRSSPFPLSSSSWGPFVDGNTFDTPLPESIVLEARPEEVDCGCSVPGSRKCVAADTRPASVHLLVAAVCAGACTYRCSNVAADIWKCRCSRSSCISSWRIAVRYMSLALLSATTAASAKCCFAGSGSRS
jgi:hypothetical protein